MIQTWLDLLFHAVILINQLEIIEIFVWKHN